MRALAVALVAGSLLALATPARAQLFGPVERPWAEVFLRPGSAEGIPAGGLFAASLSLDAESRLDRVLLVDDEGELELPLFESCVRGTRWCLYRTRFPFGRPSGNVSDVVVPGRGDIVGLQVLGPYGPARAADQSPPSGLETANLSFQSVRSQGFLPGEPTYALRVELPALADDSGVALLELFEVTEGDKDLIGHTLIASDAPGVLGVDAPVDVPEAAERCFRVEATDLGGNTSQSERLCLLLTPDAACRHTRATGSFGAAGLLAALTLAWRGPRRRQAGAPRAQAGGGVTPAAPSR